MGMGIFKPGNPPAFYYVYASKVYEEAVEEYLKLNFEDVYNLNISSSVGCGFKFISYDLGDVKRLDAWLESHEGWIQSTRRNDFNDLEADVLDLDKAIAGCNNRITEGGDYRYLNFVVNSHKQMVAVRDLNISNPNAAVGTYSVSMGADNLTFGAPANSVIDYTKLLKKDLKGESFDILLTGCNLIGSLIEYKGHEVKDFTEASGHDISAFNTNFSTSTDIVVGIDSASWWTYYDLILKEPLKIRSVNLVFGFYDNHDVPAEFGLIWIEGREKGVVKEYFHTGGVMTADHFSIQNTAPNINIRNYHVADPELVDEIKIGIGHTDPAGAEGFKLWSGIIGY
jgi:hypothetical protein